MNLENSILEKGFKKIADMFRNSKSDDQQKKNPLLSAEEQSFIDQLFENIRNEKDPIIQQRMLVDVLVSYISCSKNSLPKSNQEGITKILHDSMTFLKNNDKDKEKLTEYVDRVTAILDSMENMDDYLIAYQ